MRQFLGIDLGTSAVKCIVVNEDGNTLAKVRKTYPRIFGQPGYIEQDPKEWWAATRAAIAECLNALPTKAIAAISLSGHMSAPVLLDEKNDVIGNAILIADTRSKAETKELRETLSAKFLNATGNAPIDAFAVSKLLWLKNNQPDLCERICKVVFPKDYIRLMLTGKVATDHTDAGNSLLYHFEKRVWNDELIKEVGLPREWFPSIEESTDVSGFVSEVTAKEMGLEVGTPVVCGAADMACSQIGSGAFAEDVIALTLSTSIQVVVPVPGILEDLTNKLTYHPSADIGKMYAMSSIFSGGMSIDWLYKLLYKESNMTNEQYLELNQVMQERYSQAPLNDIIFLPFLTGSGSPWFDADDRGGFYGMSPDVQSEDLMLSVLEGIGCNVKDNIDVIKTATGKNKKIYLAGGGSMFAVWAEILANLLGQPIQVLAQKDVSSLGAVTLAGIGIGAFKSFADGFHIFNGIERVVEPNKEYHRHYEAKYRRYQWLHHSIQQFNRTLALDDL